MKKWVTVFPHCKNFHLTKDVGYIPYMMHKKYGFDSYIATYDEDNYSYLNSFVKGLKLNFLSNNIKNEKLAILKYLYINSKEIDVLHIFHLRILNLIYLYIYKICNKRGKIYLKLDANETIKNINLKGNSPKAIIIRFLLKKCDLISVESKILYSWICNNWSKDIKVKYIPNGFWEIDEYNRNNEKVNYITTVGRLGEKVKSTETLIEAFLTVCKNIPEWKLCLVGSMTEEFKEYIEKIRFRDKELEERIIIKGKIDDLAELNDIYNKSKVFCMTSLSESFGLVLVEALKSGCFIITSDILIANDVTNNGEYGVTYKAGNVKELSTRLEEVCNSIDFDDKVDGIKKYAYENFSWDILSNEIYKSVMMK